MTSNGKIRWFNTAKGYGFIIPDSGDKDVFLHARELQKAKINPATVLPDMAVGYTPNQGAKGVFATNVKLFSGS